MENFITTLVTEYGLTPIDILQTTFTVTPPPSTRGQLAQVIYLT